jgi:hypothetical protein
VANAALGSWGGGGETGIDSGNAGGHGSTVTRSAAASGGEAGPTPVNSGVAGPSEVTEVVPHGSTPVEVSSGGAFVPHGVDVGNEVNVGAGFEPGNGGPQGTGATSVSAPHTVSDPIMPGLTTPAVPAAPNAPAATPVAGGSGAGTPHAPSPGGPNSGQPRATGSKISAGTGVAEIAEAPAAAELSEADEIGVTVLEESDPAPVSDEHLRTETASVEHGPTEPALSWAADGEDERIPQWQHAQEGPDQTYTGRLDDLARAEQSRDAQPQSPPAEALQPGQVELAVPTGGEVRSGDRPVDDASRLTWGEADRLAERFVSGEPRPGVPGA